MFEGVPFTNGHGVKDDVHVNPLRHDVRGGEAHISFICDTRPYIGSDGDFGHSGAYFILDPGGQSVLLREQPMRRCLPAGQLEFWFKFNKLQEA